MRILSPLFVSEFRGRIVNIHPADTRKHRGADGYEWAQRNKLLTTVITVHLVDEGLDTGPILAQADVDLKGAVTITDIKQRGLAVEHQLYSTALRDYCARL
jgi:phosphoribosylglycinamide formyltransferase-1